MGQCELVKKVLLNDGTYTATSRSSSIDMGAFNKYRYVNTNSVPNSNSAQYTFPAGDTGGNKDLGETNSYRYVNATNVYNSGKSSANMTGVASTVYNGAINTYTSAGYTWTVNLSAGKYLLVLTGAINYNSTIYMRCTFTGVASSTAVYQDFVVQNAGEWKTAATSTYTFTVNSTQNVGMHGFCSYSKTGNAVSMYLGYIFHLFRIS